MSRTNSLARHGGRTRPDRYHDKDGYVVVVDPETNVRATEHKLVMEAELGRRLVRGESVHHKNGIRDDNRPDNLELWVGAIRYGQRAADITCPHCGVAYLAAQSETV